MITMRIVQDGNRFHIYEGPLMVMPGFTSHDAALEFIESFRGALADTNKDRRERGVEPIGGGDDVDVVSD